MKTILALLVMLAFPSPLLAEVTEFKDGGTHYINSATASYVLVDYQVPSMQTTVSLISGGSVVGLESYGTSRINVLGGIINESLRAGENSQMTMSGGILGGYLDATQNGQITIVGSGFMVDGETVDFGRLIYPSAANEGDEIARRLTGVLANGDPLNNRFFIEGDSSSITLVLASVPEPASLFVLAAGLVGLLGMIRRKK